MVHVTVGDMKPLKLLWKDVLKQDYLSVSTHSKKNPNYINYFKESV